MLVRLAQGDEEARRSVVDAHGEDIYRFLRARVRDAHEAEDLTQEVFLRFFSAITVARVRPDTKIRQYLFGIAKICVKQWAAGAARHRAAGSGEGEAASVPEQPSADPMDNPATRLDVILEARRRGWAVREMIADERERNPAKADVLWLRLAFGMPYEVISEAVDLPNANCRQIVSRKQREIIAMLKESGEFEGSEPETVPAPNPPPDQISAATAAKEIPVDEPDEVREPRDADAGQEDVSKPREDGLSSEMTGEADDQAA